VARTTVCVLPVTAVICEPLTLKTFPAPAVSNVLLVNVSVVALPTSVSVAAGRVRVPDAAAAAATVVDPDAEPLKTAPAEPIVGVVRDGLVRAALARVAPVIVGPVERTTVEPDPVEPVTALPLTLKTFPEPAVSKVLFVSVSVVAFPTRVSVAAGRVNVPEATAAACTTVEPLVPPISVKTPVIAGLDNEGVKITGEF
jgi:hypothetical protein